MGERIKKGGSTEIKEVKSASKLQSMFQSFQNSWFLLGSRFTSQRELKLSNKIPDQATIFQDYFRLTSWLWVRISQNSWGFSASNKHILLCLLVSFNLVLVPSKEIANNPPQWCKLNEISLWCILHMVLTIFCQSSRVIARYRNCRPTKCLCRPIRHLCRPTKFSVFFAAPLKSAGGAANLCRPT